MRYLQKAFSGWIALAFIHLASSQVERIPIGMRISRVKYQGWRTFVKEMAKMSIWQTGYQTEANLERQLRKQSVYMSQLARTCYRNLSEGNTYMSSNIPCGEVEYSLEPESATMQLASRPFRASVHLNMHFNLTMLDF